MAGFVRQAVESVFAQDFKEWHLVVVDNCSTDGTWEVLNTLHHPQLEILRQPRNLGAVANWNFLLERATTEFICFLGGDDWFYPNHLARKVSLLRAFPEVPLVHGPADRVDAQGSAITVPQISHWRRARRRFTHALPGRAVKQQAPDPRLQSRWTVLRRLLSYNCINVTSVVFRRATLAAHAVKFDTRLRFFIDWHLYLDLLPYYPWLAWDDQVTLAYRVHPQSDTQKNRAGFQWALEAYEHILYSLEEHPQAWMEAGFILRVERAHLAAHLLGLALRQWRAGDRKVALTVWRAFQQHQGLSSVAGLGDPRLWPGFARKRWLLT
jgi:glycosyltransferase involved in cell wall biosynthesis